MYNVPTVCKCHTCRYSHDNSSTKTTPTPRLICFIPSPYPPNVLHVLFLCSGSLVRPKVIKSVHYCPATKKTIERKYSDLTSLDPFPTSGVYPTKVTIPPLTMKFVT